MKEAPKPKPEPVPVPFFNPDSEFLKQVREAIANGVVNSVERFLGFSRAGCKASLAFAPARRRRLRQNKILISTVKFALMNIPRRLVLYETSVVISLVRVVLLYVASGVGHPVARGGLRCMSLNLLVTCCSGTISPGGIIRDKTGRRIGVSAVRQPMRDPQAAPPPNTVLDGYFGKTS
jgi:hypothetical protein